MNALLPCPLCGGEAHSSIDGNGWGESRVTCSRCGVTVFGTCPCAGEFHNNPAEKKWNQRSIAAISAYLPGGTE